ncbi:sulfotransferase family 2 domain-containing protein [Haloferula rosea]|nr:sulfotransferase family 2 domain-containing protein [Haloferula rosea]
MDKLRLLAEAVSKSWERRAPRPFICESLKLLYYVVPKAASSTVRRYLIEHGYPERRPSQLTHDHVQHFQFPRVTQREARDLVESGYRTFTVVRNPYERIVSCYRDKIVGAGSAPGPSAGFLRYNSLTGRPMFRNDMTLLEFLQIISRLPDFASDAHFRCQRTFVPVEQGEVRLDRIIQLERFSEAFPEFLVWAGLPEWQANRENPTKRSSGLLAENPGAVELIRERYASCFRLFGYDLEEVPDV